jgi:hypothetical protein
MKHLKDLEALKVIRIQSTDEISNFAPLSLSEKYAGKMTKQSIEEINRQFNDLREKPECNLSNVVNNT